jgi:hypothetical protein
VIDENSKFHGSLAERIVLTSELVPEVSFP